MSIVDTSSKGKAWKTLKSSFNVIMLWAIWLILFLLIAIPSWQIKANPFHNVFALDNAAMVSGYALLAIMLLLGLFRVRKYFALPQVGKAKWWFNLHVLFGMLALSIYLLHTNFNWIPAFGYEQVLALCVYIVVFSGVAGYFLQRYIPKRLVYIGGEIIYEKIPDAIYQLRNEAQFLLLKSNEDTGYDTLSKYYIDTLDWYFRRPRFTLSHIIAGFAAQHWLDNTFKNINSQLNKQEQQYSQDLQQLAHKKLKIDLHYANQKLLKLWLFVHISCTAALLLMSLWHLLLVNIYTL